MKRKASNDRKAVVKIEIAAAEVHACGTAGTIAFDWSRPFIVIGYMRPTRIAPWPPRSVDDRDWWIGWLVRQIQFK